MHWRRRTEPVASSAMEWTAEVGSAAWLAERLDEPWTGTIHDVVPRGFSGYARVLHRATRERPVGQPWPPLPYAAHRAEWETFVQGSPEIESENVTWARAAGAFSTGFHPTVSWQSIVEPGVVVENEDGPRDAEGWRYREPDLGQLDPETLARLASHLAARTTTPEAGHIAVWEGWGGLLGHTGPTPSRAFFQVGGDARHRRLLANLVPEGFRSPWAKDRWQPGILPDDVSRGSRLELPHRGHVLFAGGVSELTNPDWVLRAPWRDVEAEEHGFPPSAHAPSLVWPADHAWVLVSEVDWDSSIVAGDAELIATICADPELEAYEILEGTSLLEG